MALAQSAGLCRAGQRSPGPPNGAGAARAAHLTGQQCQPPGGALLISQKLETQIFLQDPHFKRLASDSEKCQQTTAWTDSSGCGPSLTLVFSGFPHPRPAVLPARSREQKEPSPPPPSPGSQPSLLDWPKLKISVLVRLSPDPQSGGQCLWGAGKELSRGTSWGVSAC